MRVISRAISIFSMVSTESGQVGYVLSNIQRQKWNLIQIGDLRHRLETIFLLIVNPILRLCVAVNRIENSGVIILPSQIG